MSSDKQKNSFDAYLRKTKSHGPLKQHVLMRLLLFVGLFISFSLYSQTIINTEKLISQNDSLVFSVQLDYAGTRGNAVTDQFDFSPSLLKVGKKSDYKFFGGYSILSAGDEALLNSAFIHARHNYKFNNKIKSFLFYQLQYNEVLLLNKRELFGFGGRYALINNDSLKFDFGMGGIYENEFLDVKALETIEIAETHYLRLSLIGSFNWVIKNGMQLNNVVYYQPYLNNLDDYRILNDFSLMFQIAKRINFVTSLTFRFDSKPPLALKDYDTNINFGINYSISK